MSACPDLTPYVHVAPAATTPEPGRFILPGSVKVMRGDRYHHRGNWCDGTTLDETVEHMCRTCDIVAYSRFITADPELYRRMEEYRLGRESCGGKRTVEEIAASYDAFAQCMHTLTAAVASFTETLNEERKRACAAAPAPLKAGDWCRCIHDATPPGRCAQFVQGRAYQVHSLSRYDGQPLFRSETGDLTVGWTGTTTTTTFVPLTPSELAAHPGSLFSGGAPLQVGDWATYSSSDSICAVTARITELIRPHLYRFDTGLIWGSNYIRRATDSEVTAEQQRRCPDTPFKVGDWVVRGMGFYQITGFDSPSWVYVDHRCLPSHLSIYRLATPDEVAAEQSRRARASEVTVTMEGKAYSADYGRPGYVRFGCATIANVFIRRAQEWLSAQQSWGNGGGDRRVEAVVLGNGTFDLSTLTRLVANLRD